MNRRLVDVLVGLVALIAIVASLVELEATTHGLRIEAVTIADTPATIFRPAVGPAGPVVVIAHGFAGSQQLMQPFAITLAQNGYTAVTFDFPGHGRNPAALTGSITEVSGATRTLVSSLARVAANARSLGDGRLAVLGHSMASDVIVRFAEESPDVQATVAVSMFSPAVTADSPRNLLVIVGDWEATLKGEALRAVGLGLVPGPAEPGVTYGDLARGTGRRAAFSPYAEHVGVLYSRASMREAVAWLDAAFAITRPEAPYLDARALWIVLLIGAIVALGRPLAGLLPVVSASAVGAGLPWRRLWVPLLVPALATPLILRLVPTHFLPVLVADYLAFHFATYGLVTMGCLWWRERARPRPLANAARGPLVVAALAVTLYANVGFGTAMNRYVTSFVPGAGRATLIVAMLVGTLSFFLADEWLTRGAGAARFAYPATKGAFVVSLAIAIALDFQRLFFLVIIVPVILVFFVIYGLFSRWAYRRTAHPFVAGIANAVGFAWAIAVTFPRLAG